MKRNVSFLAKVTGLGILVAGLTIAGLAQAGTTQSKKGAFKATNWATKCKKDPAGRKVCQLSHMIIQAKKKTVLLGTRIRWSAGKKSYVMVFQMPHGLILPKGVVMQVGKSKVIRVPILTSDVRGVYSTMSLSAGLVRAMKNGAVMNVSFVAANSQRVTVPVSLRGFSAGFNKLGR
jgi:invasion protein IalB